MICTSDEAPTTPRKKTRNRPTGVSQDSAYIASPRTPRDSFDKKPKKYDDNDDDNDYSDTSSHGDPFGEDERDGLLEADIDLEPHVLVLETRETELPKEKPKPVSWSSLPKKGQLFLLTFSRLSEPICQTSLQAYMFYQLRSFNPDLPDSTISYQAGMLQATFTGAQFCTAILWGRIADSESMGRKRVILIGLAGTSLGSLGLGFSQTFRTALFWRAVGGALNGNVGVMRTMISETIKEKKYQSRAFLLLPLTFNCGVIVGPIIGGLLADPISSYPWLFGENSIFGGADGVWWMKEWRYALPNLVTAVFMCVATSVVILGLEETLESRRDKRDIGLEVGDWIKRRILRMDIPPNRAATAYTALHATDDIELAPHASTPPPKRVLPFRRVFTPNLLMVMLAHGILAAHLGAFSNLWFVFLSTPRYDPSSPNPSLHLPASYTPKAPFIFTGGLGLPPASIGTSLAILGTIGISLQLFLYPRLSFRYGTTRCYRVVLALFPLVYFLIPFLAQAPTPDAPPAPASGVWFWAALVGVLSLQVLARTFALPGTTILLNNACPHPSVLGTVHGLGQSASSLMRTFGPLVGGWAYGSGLRSGVVGLVFWAMAVWASVGFAAGQGVREGDGHEILLEGETKDEEGR